ncbi:radical SAM protein [Thermoproteota archaeon]
MTDIYPSYIAAHKSGELKKRIEEAYKLLRSCTICPRKCKVNRLKDQRGFCKIGLYSMVCSYMAHHGEEPPISGKKGSGTIFFSYCNMKCVYCQNYHFSQEGEGEKVSPERLSEFMLELQKQGCHNINFVTPTHVMPQILKSLEIAIEAGLNIPLVYNTSGYELPEIIKMLDGIIDVYLVDMRYSQSKHSEHYSQAPDYPKHNQESLKEMYRQVGDAEIDDSGIIKKGIIIRHLVLPNDISGTQEILKFISEELSQNTYVSLMSQYSPYYQAYKYPEIARRISKEEYKIAIDYLKNNGLENGWIQDFYGLESLAGVHIKKNT